MKRFIIFAISIVYLSGCMSMVEKVLTEKDKPVKEETIEIENEETDLAVDPTNMDAWDPEALAKLNKDELEDFYEKAAKQGVLDIKTKKIGSQYNEDGDYKYHHTEKEIVEEYMDENGRIYFDFDDYPIRSIESMDGNINYIMNYSDAFIEAHEGEAYIIPESHIETAYEFFIANQPKELQGKDPSEYRTWEEATNLERSIIQIIELSGPLLNDLGLMMENDIYSGVGFEKILEEYEKLGSPSNIIPAPQTVSDAVLYENMQLIHQLWGQLGTFQNPEQQKEAFDEVYNELRQEMNNIIVRVNYTLGEED